MSSGLLPRVCNLVKFTDVSEILSASVVIVLMMEAASTSETSVNFTRLHGATIQKTTIFILAAVRT
jgi:hypothetical protein